MDIGKILRERSKFPAYRSEPKKKNKNWAIYPSLKVDNLVFYEDDEFRCLVSLFSYDRDEILMMQDTAIAEAKKGMKKDGWTFWLHAARHKVEQVDELYCSKINFTFKVNNGLKGNRNEEVK